MTEGEREGERGESACHSPLTRPLMSIYSGEVCTCLEVKLGTPLLLLLLLLLLLRGAGVIISAAATCVPATLLSIFCLSCFFN